MLSRQDPPMTTTTVLILNGALVVGLLIALAVVMRLGHRAADSSARPADTFGRPELERVRTAETSTDLERAA
jgi:hypothetical protein